MTLFRSRFLQRLADVTEWIDYRREASLWPFLLLPPLLSVAWAYGGVVGLGIVVAFGVAVAVLALTTMLCGVALWILGNATIDTVKRLARTAISSDRSRGRLSATIR